MSATLGPITAAYVSSVDSMLNTREILKQVSDIQNEDGLTELMIDLGRTLPTTQGVYYNFVNDTIFKLIDTTNSTITGSGTRTVTISGVTAATSGYNRINDMVILPSTLNNVAIITAVSTSSNQDTITIKGVSGVTLSVTAGDKLPSFSVAVGERSDTPLNLRYGLTKYYNKVQIQRETSQITDVENALTLEVNFNGQPKIIVKDHLEKTIKMKGNLNAAFLMSDVSDTSFTDASPALVDNNAPTNGGGGGPIQTTRGLDKYITTYGVSTTAASPGTVAIADFNTMADALIANRCPKQYMVVGSSAARRAMDVYIQNLNNSGLTSIRMNVDVQGGKKVNTQVLEYKYGNFEFNFGDMPILDHPVIAFGTVIKKSMYFLPLSGTVKVEGGANMPNMQIRYFPKQTKYGNDMINEIPSGAFNPISPSGTISEWRTDWETTQGLEVLGAQWFGRMQVLA